MAALLVALLLASSIATPSAAAGGAVTGAREDSIDFLSADPIAAPSTGGRRHLADDSWAVPKHKPTATARLLASITSGPTQGTGASPTTPLSQACRAELATMFASPSLCDATTLGQVCTSVMEELLAWRVLCISGVFASRTASLFLPTTKGAKKVVWGREGYLGQLGSISGSKKAVLGPVLAAITQKPNPAKTLILFNWVSEMVRLVYKKSKTSADTATKVVLGRAALKTLNHDVTVVAPKAPNATAPRGRESQPPQYTQLAFVENVLIGSGYDASLQPLWPPQLWYSGSLQIFDYPTGSATSTFKESSSSSEIADSLEIAGSGEYNGGLGLKVSASASYMNSRLSSSTAYLATLAKRTYQVPDAVLGTLQLADQPKLSQEAADDLSNYGKEYFADKYGVFFVHSVLYKAYADAWAQAYTSESSNSQVVSAAVSGSYGGFSASMEGNWSASQKSKDYQYSVITSSSFPCATQKFADLESCSNDAIKNVAPALGYKLILMRMSDLPDYQRVLRRVVLPTKTPYDLLADDLKRSISKAWARGQYLLLTVAKVLTTQIVQGNFDCGGKCFQKNAFRILQVLSDIAANKELDTGGSKVFLAADPAAATKIRIIKWRTDSTFTRTLTSTVMDSVVSWASVGPGVLVTLFANSVTDDEKTAFHLGEGVTKIPAFQSQFFAGQARAVKVEYIAGMDIDRRMDILDIMAKQLDDLESNARWSTNCIFARSCSGANEFAQALFLNNMYSSHSTCCTIPDLGRRTMTVSSQVSTTITIDPNTCPPTLAVACNGAFGGALKIIQYQSTRAAGSGLPSSYLDVTISASCWSLPGLATRLTGCRQIEGVPFPFGLLALQCNYNERLTDISTNSGVVKATCCRLPK